jgi:hypothetical protein
MTFPVQDTAVVTEGQALTTSRYATAPVVQGILAALLTRCQQIENDYWSFITGVQLANHPMAGGPWSVLDQIGALVGAPPRNGLADANYLQMLKIAIRANSSHGWSEDVIQVAKLIGTVTSFTEVYPASFRLTMLGLSTADFPALTYFLPIVRSAGTLGELVYSTDPASEVFYFADTVNLTTTPGTGLGDTVSGTDKFGLLSGVVI